MSASDMNGGAARQTDAGPPSLTERLRRVTWSRVLFMIGLIAIGLLLTRVVGGGGPRISESEAVAIARPRVDFQPQEHQIRFIRRGVPPHGFWVVSFYIRKLPAEYKRLTVVLVDASTGLVTEVRRER